MAGEESADVTRQLLLADRAGAERSSAEVATVVRWGREKKRKATVSC